jgi:hypothetical protein
MQKAKDREEREHQRAHDLELLDAIIVDGELPKQTHFPRISLQPQASSHTRNRLATMPYHPPTLDRATDSGLVRRFYKDVWNAHDRGAIAQLLTEDFRFRGSLGARAYSAFAGTSTCRPGAYRSGSTIRL